MFRIQNNRNSLWICEGVIVRRSILLRRDTGIGEFIKKIRYFNVL